jgi:hypothetical protein
MTEKRLYVVTAANRPYICQQIHALEVGDQVRVGPPDRLLVQNARFHAMCGDVARQSKYMGRTLSLAQWKVLLISAFTIESGEEADMVPGLTGEYVNLRESTALMSIRRIASLIEYVACWGAENGITFKERHF